MTDWTEKGRGVRLVITKIFIEECTDCPLRGQGINQMQFCSFYKRSHDEDKPKFCRVKWLAVTEDGGSDGE